LNEAVEHERELLIFTSAVNPDDQKKADGILPSALKGEEI
jgi:hypothetical protein